MVDGNSNVQKQGFDFQANVMDFFSDPIAYAKENPFFAAIMTGGLVWGGRKLLGYKKGLWVF